MTLSQKDLNAVIVDRAYANSEKASKIFYDIVWEHGEPVELEANIGCCSLIRFYGRFYA